MRRTLRPPARRRTRASCAERAHRGGCRERELPRAVGLSTTIVRPTAYGSDALPGAAEHDRCRTVHVGGTEAIRFARAPPSLRPERPLPDVAAGVREPERAALRDRSRRRRRCRCCGGEAVGRDPHVAARRDVPAAHLVAAAAVLVGIARHRSRRSPTADTVPATVRSRSGRRGGGRNERQNRNQHIEPFHRLERYSEPVSPP